MPATLVSSSDCVAERLCAAKPVTWRGRGDLVQVPIPSVTPGLILVLDMWAGISGAIIALLGLGCRVIVLAAESDPLACAASQAVMPNIVHIPKVEMISAKMLVPILRRRKVAAVLYGGGAPCQGNTSLNKQRQGLDDLRSHQPHAVHLLGAELRMLLDTPEFANQKIALLRWLENVRSAPPAVIEQYSEWLGCQPVEVRAARCGYVERNRFLWGAGPDTSVAELGGSCPPDWQMVPGFKSFLELQYIGKRPLPARVHFQQGFKPLMDP